jgi:hypothetical protein
MEKLMTKKIHSCYECVHKTVGFTCDLMPYPENNINEEHGWIPDWCPLPDASQPENSRDEKNLCDYCDSDIKECKDGSPCTMFDNPRP